MFSKTDKDDLFWKEEKDLVLVNIIYSLANDRFNYYFLE